MIGFIKNHFYRIRSRKYYIIISLVMTIISIFFAVYFTSKFEVKGSIVVVTSNDSQIFQSKYIKFTQMEKKPPRYQLVLGKYDGIIIDHGNGKFEVETIKNNDFRKMMEEIIENPKGYVPESKDTRGVGSNIIGYLLMFLLLQCVLFMFTLAEDMELKQIERIAAAPVSFFKYLLSHFLITFLLTFVPAFLILAVMKDVLMVNIGFDLLQYATLLCLICTFGISFSMFIVSLVKVSDTANMMGSSIVLLTTILAGSFYSFEKGNGILEKTLLILPQKGILFIAQGIEVGRTVFEILPQLFYIIIISFLFFTLSVIKIKNDYVQRS